MILISHSDENYSEAVAMLDFLLETTTIDPNMILCSALEGHQPSDGQSITEFIKNDKPSRLVTFAIIDPHSIHNDWQQLEIGAAWCMSKLLLPILLTGMNVDSLPAPLKACTCISVEEKDAHKKILYLLHILSNVLEVGKNESADVSDAIARLLAKIGPPSGTGRTMLTKQSLADSSPSQSPKDAKVMVAVTKLGKKEFVVVKLTWEDIFKTIGNNLNTPREDSLLQSLLLDICKSKDPDLAHGLAYKIMTEAHIAHDNYIHIRTHFATLGYIEPCAKPKGTLKTSKETLWCLTARGAEYLNSLMTFRRQFTD